MSSSPGRLSAGLGLSYPAGKHFVMGFLIFQILLIGGSLGFAETRWGDNWSLRGELSFARVLVGVLYLFLFFIEEIMSEGLEDFMN